MCFFLIPPPPPPHPLLILFKWLAVCHLSIELYYEIHFCEIKKNIYVKTTFSFFLEMAILDAQVCQARQQPMRNSDGAIHMGCQACRCLVLPLATCFRTAWNSTQTEMLWCFIRTANGCLFSSCWHRCDYICNGVVERRRALTQAAASVKWRPQQAYGSNQVLFAQQQTISQHTQNPHSHA